MQEPLSNKQTAKKQPTIHNMHNATCKIKKYKHSNCHTSTKQGKAMTAAII
jgi:hypothetical protein